MSGREYEFSLEWLEKARHDLYAIDKLSEDTDAPGDIIAFHCQQAIEKSLKGLLTAKNRSFPRTHDLVDLVDIIVLSCPSLRQWRDACKEISRYAVEIRYPDACCEPSGNELKRAKKASREIFTISQKLIQDEM